MSQVKKFQAGGKFRMNGRELLGQKALDNLAAAYAGSDPSERGMWNVAQRAIQDGNTAQYNADNSISVFDQNGKDITEHYTNTKASTSDKGIKRFFDAVTENESHRFKKSGRYMSLVDMGGDSEESVANNKTKLNRGSGWWEFSKDKDGKDVYINGVNNEAKMNILRGIRTYFDDANPETLGDRYDLTGWDKNLMDAFASQYGKISQINRDEYWNQLRDRIKSGKTTLEDDQLLTSWGFTKPTSTSGSGAGSSAENPWASDWKGNRNAAEAAGIRIVKGNDGNYYIEGDNPYKSGTYYLRGYDWAAGTDFENGVLHNGRFYTKDQVFNESPDRDSAIRNMQTAVSPFIQSFSDRNLSWNERWNRAKQSGVHWYGENNNIWEQNVNPNAGWTENWTKFFRDSGLEGDYSLLDATDMFDNTNGRQVIAYINNSNYGNRNEYGIDEPRYMIRDTDGTVAAFDSLDALKAATGLNSVNDLYKTSYRDLQYNPYSNINGSDYATYKEFTSGNQKNTILVGKDGYLYWAKRDQNGNLMQPKRIYDVDTVQELLANPSSHAKDINKLYSKVTLAPSHFVGTDLPWWNLRFRQNKINSHPELQQSPQRYQWGGPIQNLSNNVISARVEDAKTDVSNMHAIDATQGGLTDDEKKLIIAAAGDLAGVGLTFIPGGGIAGAATGAASSLTRFSANKEMGVNNPGWKLAGDLVLDTASILPIVGTGAKAVKAASTIRAAAKPIMKLLAISGAAAPVITAVQRIASGEKYTSADLAEAIRGVGSAVVAGNLISQDIGNAKLAASKAKSFAEADAKGIRKGEVTLEGNKKFTDESSVDELKKFIQDNPTEKKALDAVINTAKKDGISLSESQARSILEQEGITFEKGKIKVLVNPFKKASRQAWLKRPEATLELKTPAAYSAARYYFSPSKRADILGSKAVYGFGKKQGLLGDTTAEELSAALKRLQAGEGSAVDKALLRMTAYEPQAFGDLLKVGETKSGKTIYRPVQGTRNEGDWIFGGKRYYRLPAHAGTSGRLVGPEVNYGYPLKYLPATKEPLALPAHVEQVYTPQQLYLGAAPEQLQLGSSPRVLQLPSFQGTYNPTVTRSFAWTAGRYPGIMLDTPTPIIVGKGRGFLMMKSGGKMRIAQNGLNTDDLSKLLGRTISPEEAQVINTRTTGLYNKYNINKKNPLTGERRIELLGQTLTPIENLKSTPSTATRLSAPTLAYKETADIDSSIGDRGGIWDTIDFNKANLNDLMRGVVAARMIKQDLDDSIKSNEILKTRQFQTPILKGRAYDFSDIERKYQLAKEPLRKTKLVSSDNFANLAGKLAISENLSNLGLQQGAEESARISEIRNYNDQRDDQNTINRVQTANEKSNYLTQLESREPMLRVQARDFLHANVLGPLGQQFGQQIRDAQNLENQLLLEKSFGEMSQTEKATLDAKLAKYKNDWLNSTERQNGADFEDYMLSDVTRAKIYNDANSAYSRNLNAKLAGLRLQNVWNQGAGILKVNRSGVYKSGGKVSVTVNNRNKYNRDVREQIAIDGNRNAQKNAQKLSDNLARLLQQLLSK